MRRRSGTRTRATRRSFTRSATRPRSMPRLPRPTISSVTRSDQPGHRQQHGAARLPRPIRPGSGPLYDPLHHPVGARHQGGAGRSHLQAAATPVPGGLRQYGRRLRHEGRLLPGIRAVAVGIRGHRPPGALDRRAQRRAAERRAGARQHRRDRAGARQGRPVSGAARRSGRRRSAPIFRPTGRRYR